MSEHMAPDDDEWTLAASEIAALFRAVRNGGQAPDLLLAVEMVVQGLAYLHGLDVVALRRDVARGWAGPNVNLAAMPVQGTA